MLQVLHDECRLLLNGYYVRIHLQYTFRLFCVHLRPHYDHWSRHHRVHSRINLLVGYTYLGRRHHNTAEPARRQCVQCHTSSHIPITLYSKKSFSYYGPILFTQRHVTGSKHGARLFRRCSRCQNYRRQPLEPSKLLWYIEDLETGSIYI